MTEENDHSTQRGRWAESVALRGHQNRVHRNRGVKFREVCTETSLASSVF